MRNLKRALSLALASVMVLGLMIVGTSAVGSYPDVDTEDHVEAIEVLKAVGVMEGDTSGNFNPDQNLTREEMATVMCHMLDYKVSNYAGTCPFTDVSAWAEPYVAACYTHGIVAGYSATTYGAKDNVTAVQASLMLMKALGYFQYQSDFGESYKLSTMSKANQIDLYEDVDVPADQALTRNDLAQLVLNTLKATQVVVAETPITINGETVRAAIYTYVGKAGDRYETIRSNTVVNRLNGPDTTVTNGLPSAELGEDLFAGKLVLNIGDQDDFGRPASQWTYNGNEVGKYADTPVATWTAKVSKSALQAAVGNANVGNLAGNSIAAAPTSANTWAVWVDGAPATAISKGNMFDRTSDTHIVDASGNNLTGNGVLTEVYVDDDNKVNVVIINTYLAQANGDYNESRGTVTIDAISSIALDSNLLYGADFDVAGVKDNDYLLLTVHHDAATDPYIVSSVAPAELVKGEVTSFTAGTRVTVAGTSHDYAMKADDDSVATSYSVGDEAAVVLDAYGYILYVDDATIDNGRYVYINEVKQSAGLGRSWSADAYFTDGTNSVIPLNKINNGTPSAINAGATPGAGWYTYSITDSDKYDLKKVGDVIDFTPLAANSNAKDNVQYPAVSKVLTKGTVAFATATTEGSGTSEVRASLRANAATIFIIINDKNDVKFYTGIGNAPTIELASAKHVNVHYVNNDNGYARFVFMDVSGSGLLTSGGYQDQNSESGLIFIMHKDKTTTEGGNKTYTLYKVLKDGVEEDLKVANGNEDKFDEGALMQDLRYNSDGYATDGTTITSSVRDWSNKLQFSTANDPVKFNEKVLSICGTDMVMADGAQVYLVIDKNAGALLIKDSNEYEVRTPNAEGLYRTLRGYTYAATCTFQYKTNADMQVTDLYVYINSVSEDTAIVGWKVTAGASNTGIKTTSIETASATNSSTASIAVTIKKSTAGSGDSFAANDTLTLTPIAADGASVNGKIVIKTSDTGNTWKLDDTVTGNDGKVTITGIKNTPKEYDFGSASFTATAS